MKIYSRDEFLKLPCPVVYMKWGEDFISSEVMIKYENLGNDWCYTDLFSGFLKEDQHISHDDILYKVIPQKDSFNLDFDIGARDGCFDDNEVFAVFEKEDIKGVINQLLKVLTGE